MSIVCLQIYLSLHCCTGKNWTISQYLPACCVDCCVCSSTSTKRVSGDGLHPLLPHSPFTANTSSVVDTRFGFSDSFFRVGQRSCSKLQILDDVCSVLLAPSPCCSWSGFVRTSPDSPSRSVCHQGQAITREKADFSERKNNNNIGL